MKFVEEMLDEILLSEGGFTDDKEDPAHQIRKGGKYKYNSYCTNHGVTQYTLSNYWKRQASVDEVRRLTQEEAREIYRSEYYITPKINQLPEGVQPCVLDMSINHGPQRAIKLFQKVLVMSGFPVEMDGGIGFKTLRATEAAYDYMGGWLVNALVEERVDYYERLIKRRPNLSKYRNGWIKRTKKYLVVGQGEQFALSKIELMEVA